MTTEDPVNTADIVFPMFLEHRLTIIETRKLSLLDSLQHLRSMSLDDFGLFLLSLPNRRFPHLSSMFPAMSPSAVQLEWTGSSGIGLLNQSIAFVNFLATNFCAFTGRAFVNTSVLDFGCGWGRLLRLMPFFHDPPYINGCDAWVGSLDHSRAAHIERVTNKLQLSESIPDRLPYEYQSIDLIYAFSIFTHLSEESARSCLSAFRKAIRPDGIVILTIRPIEIWAGHGRIETSTKKIMYDTHQSDKFAFYPHKGDKILSDGSNATYGDTSIPVSFFETLPDWTLARIGGSLIDKLQVYVVLKPT